jgi:pimeloyl-ACP methyl ester carboxylesterase
MPKRTPEEIAALRTRYTQVYDAALAKWPVAVERLDIPTPQGTTRVNACGPAGAPPIVLMPGGGASSVIYLNNVAELARDHRVYAVDSPASAGLSVYDGDKLKSVEDVLTWFDHVFDGLGIDQATLVGHSLNGWTTANYALSRPARVSHLVLLDPTACFAPTRLAYSVHGIPVLLGRKGAVRKFVEWETGGRPIDPECLAVMCAPRPGPDSFVWPKLLKPEAFRDFQVRTTVVAAMRTKMVDPARLTRNARNAVRHVEIVEIPDASHMTVPTEHAAEVNAAILGKEKVQA